MATYNGEKYLTAQIDSILSQSIQDIELVISDDCSTDGTFRILNSYALKDNRVKVFRNEVNLGYLKNFERVLSLTKGDYIALSDQDDIWTNNHLEILLDNIGNSVLSCGNVSITNECGTETGHTWDDIHLTNVMPKDNNHKLMSLIYFRGCYQGASMLFKRELLKYLTPFPPNITFHDFWISCVACLYGGIAYSEDVIAYYRIHGNNLSGNHNNRFIRRYFFKCLCVNGMNPDRIYYINGLKCLPNINNKAMRLINNMENFYYGNKSIYGKISNIFYILRNCKEIYCIS